MTVAELIDELKKLISGNDIMKEQIELLIETLHHENSEQLVFPSIAKDIIADVQVKAYLHEGVYHG